MQAHSVLNTRTHTYLPRIPPGTNRTIVNNLTLLVISDTHTIDRAHTPHPDSTRRCELGNELVERAIRDAQLEGGFDGIALMGDLTEDGSAPGAERDIAALEERVFELAGDTPLMVVPGNHDPDAEFCLRLFNDHQGLHRLKGYRFYTFLDQWDVNDVGHRPPEQLQSFLELAGDDSGAPLIVLQHNPLYPPIQDEYPFILADNEHILNLYEQAGVELSLSAHYHPGQKLVSRNGVRYWTSPALSEPPFRYALVHLRGRDVQIEPRQLKLPDEVPLMDVHAHTHYAYCADNVTAAGVIQRASTFNVTTQCLTEHADQLYMSREEHAAGLPFEQPGYWDRDVPDTINRMQKYRREVGHLRNKGVRLGTEIELDRDGAPGIHPDDLRGWDITLGSVHWLPGNLDILSQEEIHKSFLWNVRTLLDAGIDILGHPFRFFRAGDMDPPKDIYDAIVEMLQEHGAAAELNFHYNDPDAEFFRQCLDHGVPVATGTDAHKLSEVGALKPHISFMTDLVGKTGLEEVLLTDIGEDNAEIR